MKYRSDDATTLVGMPELVLRAQSLRARRVVVARRNSSHDRGCPGAAHAVRHGRSRTPVRDLPIAGHTNGAGAPAAPLAMSRSIVCGHVLV